MDLTGDYRYSEMSSLIEQETGKHPQPQPSTTTPTISLSAYTFNYVMRSAFQQHIHHRSLLTPVKRRSGLSNGLISRRPAYNQREIFKVSYCQYG
jgi:hypothetical protein